MALVKRILLFLLSIVFTILLLIGATTSYAKDEFDMETMEPNLRFYTIEWIDVANEHNKKYISEVSHIILNKKTNIDFQYEDLKNKLLMPETILRKITVFNK